MVDPDQTPAAEGGAARRFLTFWTAERLYALPAEDVVEVVRVPAVARVPQGPVGLMGVANLRGSVLPVASLRGLLGQEAIEPPPTARVLVLSGAAPVALAVDRVDALVAVAPEDVDTGQTMLAERPGERLLGAFRRGGEGDVATILDIQSLLAGAFAQRPRAPRVKTARAVEARGDVEGGAAAQDKLVTFEVGGQEYALRLEQVLEIIPAPQGLALDPRGDALVLGVAGYRDTLLPLFSLRGLLGFPKGDEAAPRKVVVTRVRGALVGLLTDRMRTIIPVDPSLLEPTPSVLAARTGGEARIKAIYRAEGGRRLISVLDPELLFQEEVMTRLTHTNLDHASDMSAAEQDSVNAEALTFLVFKLGEEEFGLPITVVDEVARAPARITRLPKTPAFLEGVVNLRGDVLPVVDQRRRFEMPPMENPAGRRLVVVRTGRLRAGLIVDSVSQVLRSAADRVEEAPDLTGEAVRLVRGVINLEEAGRIVLLLDPEELLSRAERGLLDAFAAEASDTDGVRQATL
jgi:purine-binding chemotaxis protein CheW